MKLLLLWPLKLRKYRKLGDEWTYYRLQKQGTTSDCSFCDYQTKHASDLVVEATDSMLVIRNRFPYVRWDQVRISDHLMIIPLRHLHQLEQLNEKEWLDYRQLMVKYDKQGYSSYMRSDDSPIKTIKHLHLHLLKTAHR